MPPGNPITISAATPPEHASPASNAHTHARTHPPTYPHVRLSNCRRLMPECGLGTPLPCFGATTGGGVRSRTVSSTAKTAGAKNCPSLRTMCVYVAATMRTSRTTLLTSASGTRCPRELQRRHSEHVSKVHNPSRPRAAASYVLPGVLRVGAWHRF
jgi:hypothetical protein